MVHYLLPRWENGNPEGLPMSWRQSYASLISCGYCLTSSISNPRNWAKGSGYRSVFIILILSPGLLIPLSIRGVVVMEDLAALSSSPTSRQAKDTGK